MGGFPPIYAEGAIRYRPERLDARIILASALGYMGRVENAEKVIEGDEEAAKEAVEK